MHGRAEILFYVGEQLPGEFEDVESGSFAGLTFREIQTDLDQIYELDEPFHVLVNGETVSRKHHPLDYGDEVRILLQADDAEPPLAEHGYLRRQTQPAGTAGPHPLTAPPAEFSKANTLPKRSWVQTDLDNAIRQYTAQRAAQFDSLREAVKAGRKGAVEQARKLFGRNVIATALGVKSRAMLSKSPAWREIATDLGLLRDGLRRLDKSKKIGLEIAAEKKAASEDDPVVEEVSRREAATFIRLNLESNDADLLLDQLELGRVSPDQAMAYAKVMRDNRDDTRTQPRRKPL